MRKTRRFLSVAALGALVWGLSGPAAHAGVLITFVESGGDVIANGSGSINLSALSLVGSSNYVAALQANLGATTLGTSGTATDYSGITGPANFGTGNFFVANSSSGDLMGVIAIANRVTVPLGYVSGASLTGSATFTGKTFASLGLTTGTYRWTWGTGGTADSLTVQVGATAAVPEPSTWALCLIGLAFSTRRIIRRR